MLLALVGAGVGAATVVLLHDHHPGTGQGTSATSSTPPKLPSASTAPSIVDAINKQSTGPLPSGFTTYSHHAASNETAGFSLAAPASWQASTSGHQTFLTDPTVTNANILIDLTAHTFPGDMLREARYIKSQSLSKFPGYVQLGLAATTIRGTSGAYWKFTWIKEGVQQEVIDLLFVTQTSAGPQSYALYMTAPASMFDQLRPTFDEEAETFTPLP